MVKVSVIIPALNEEKFIERTLKSVSKQTIPRDDYEIIVSDGKSKDKTVSIAKKYADKVVSTKNKSISEGRNDGASLAKGDILVFVDADTRVKKTLLESVIREFEDKKVAGGFVKYYFDTNNFFIIMVNSVFIVLSFLANIFFPKALIVAGVCIIARKKVFDKIKGFNPDLRTSEDYDLMERLRKKGKFILVNESVYTSDRRLRKMGYLGLLKYYLTDFYKHHFTKGFKGDYISQEEL